MNKSDEPDLDKPGRVNDPFEIDASDLAPLLGVRAPDLLQLLRNGEVTSILERGERKHAGTYRLTFLYKRIRARLVMDRSGTITRRSSIDYGNLPKAKL